MLVLFFYSQKLNLRFYLKEISVESLKPTKFQLYKWVFKCTQIGLYWLLRKVGAIVIKWALSWERTEIHILKKVIILINF